MKKSIVLLVAIGLVLGMMANVYAIGEETEIGVVQTKYGKMAGVVGESEEVTLFKGVPYAKPPVGELRWAPPEDPESWDDIRLFDSYGDAAMMYTFDGDMNAEPWKSDFYYDGTPSLSEDCLYLNIATSARTGNEKMPVYIWFHGGGLRHGFSYEVEFNNDVLAKKGIVVVTVGHRLGVFGFMALPQLSEASAYGASGNYGVMDTIKALEWVKENISAFGGDPNNITLGGQSGGSSKAMSLLVSDKSREMVDKIIFQSGLKFNTTYGSLEEAERQGVEWLQHLGLNGDESLEELRSMDAKFFMGKEYSNYKRLAPSSMIVDGEYIKVPTSREVIFEGGLEGVDVMTGTNLGEGDYDDSIANKEDFYAYYQEILGDLYDKYDFENLVTVNDQNANDLARKLASYGFATRDSRNVTLAQLFGKLTDNIYQNNGIYAYLFSHYPPGRNEEEFWSWHSSEMWYTFASLRDIPEQRDWEEYDYELADIMSSYWANFMKKGDPNDTGLPLWKPSNKDGLSYIELGDKILLDTHINKLDRLMIEYVERQFGI